MLLPNEIGERKHNYFFLKAYFESKEKEVVDIMMALYDEEEVMKRYVESEKYKKPTSGDYFTGRVRSMIYHSGRTLVRSMYISSNKQP